MADLQATILDAFQTSSYVPNLMDVQHSPIYDTITIAGLGTVSNLTTAFFTQVGPASGKTLGQTNMTQQQKLMAPQAFSIFAIRLRWKETILRADLDAILDAFCLEFSKGEKVYNRAPLWYYSCGGGIAGFTTRTDESAYLNGPAHRESMHKLAIPLVIENQETFVGNFQGTPYVLVNPTLGGTGLTTVCLLDGFYAKGVQ